MTLSRQFWDPNNSHCGQSLNDFDTGGDSLGLNNELWATQMFISPNTNWEGSFPPDDTQQLDSPVMNMSLQNFPPLSNSPLSNSSPFEALPSMSTSISQSLLVPSSTPDIQPSPSSLPFTKSPHLCTICRPNRLFPNSQGLRRQMKIHNKRISCLSPTCNARFAENRDMHRHVSVHHHELVSSQLYTCIEPGCKYALLGNGFRRKDNLKRHLKNVHGRLTSLSSRF
ncbi:hypothetical protein F5882DRAFT_412966 [Hyaloscypha sp. PMI_1271]|nr:hypothetical protein F5882DRAFT_412966 [Hyaloscypha sp. PMI_1271]